MGPCHFHVQVHVLSTYTLHVQPTCMPTCFHVRFTFTSLVGASLWATADASSQDLLGRVLAHLLRRERARKENDQAAQGETLPVEEKGR